MVAAPAVIIVSVVGVGCYQQLDGQFVSLPPAFLPPSSSSSSSSLCAEEHKLSNTSTAAHISSVLQLSAPCLHTEGFEWADWATINTHTAQFLTTTSCGLGFFHILHPELCCRHSSLCFFSLLVIFYNPDTWTFSFLSLPLSVSRPAPPLLPSSLHAR